MRSRAAAVVIVTFVSRLTDAAVAQLAIRPGVMKLPPKWTSATATATGRGVCEMKRLCAALAVVAMSSLALHAEVPALEPKLVLDGRVSMLIPRGFAVMSDELRNSKYPSASRPALVYTNDRASINVALGHTPHTVKVAELGMALESVASSFKNIYPTAQWFRSEMRTINGRQFFLVELRTPAVDTEVRNIIVGTSLDDRLLMITFNVTKALEQEWLAAGNQIIESIKVK
jgi:hypothetical protein